MLLALALFTPLTITPGFDTASGGVDTTGAAFAVSFDDASSIQSHGMQGSDVFTQASFDGVAIAGRIERDDVLEGTGALALGGDLNYVTIDLTSQTALIGKRVEFRLWQKPEGTRMTPSISWYQTQMWLGGTLFQPTGRATDDGWEEWTSGPIDFAWQDQLPATAITLFDENVNGAYGGLAENTDARVLVDGLFAIDLGDALVPATKCALPTESTDCGDAGLCEYGRCVDGAQRAGQPLLDPTLRNDYIDRREFEVALFEGGRAPETKAPLLDAALDGLRTDPKASTFWPTFATAYTLLVDGHASAPMATYPAYLNAGVCVHLGVADLLPGAPVVPLVFQNGSNAVTAQLQPGDALVQIDGVDVDTWAADAGRLITHPGDPHSRAVVTAPQIFVAAIDAGAVVTFARCDHTDGTPCVDADVQHITLDLGALVGDPLRAGADSPVTYGDTAACDYRFIRPVDGSAQTKNTDYVFAGSHDDGDVRFLVINGVPAQQEQGGQAWFNAVDGALSSDPAKLVLDERTGDGGGIDAVDWIGGALSSPNDLYAMDFLPAIEADALGDDRAAVVACSTGPNAQQGYGCGNGFRWPFGETSQQKLGEAKDSKLAVLIGLDVSGNDYLTKIVRHRSGETRIFGHGSTWGAFGVIWSMAAHLGELTGGSLQVQDTIFMTSADDTNTTFPTSTGEVPDEDVLQKQSDAVAGKDTAIEAAKAWLAQ